MNYGVIAEFNPFHNGHKFLFDSLKENENDTVTAVMSQSFVQRGECAVMSASARAECALKNGADLVLSLPFGFAVSSAERFAYGGVNTLHSLGVIDCLAFGSECGDEEFLMDCADTLFDPAVEQKLAELLETGISYPAARSAAVSAVYGEKFNTVLSSPNDTLAVEYIAALYEIGAPAFAAVSAVKRAGNRHDSSLPEGDFASATFIRECMKNGTDFKKYVPESAYEIIEREISARRAPADMKNIENAVLYKLRTMSAGDFAKLPDVAEGLENRICGAVREACSLTEVYDKIKTKRYTHSRIRRIVLNAFLGAGNLPSDGVPYIRVLGFNEKGAALLAEAKKKADVPIVTKHSETLKLDASKRDYYEKECYVRDIFSLCQPEIQPCGLEMTEKIVIL